MVYSQSVCVRVYAYIHLTSLHFGPVTIRPLHSLCAVYIYSTRALGKAIESNSSYNRYYSIANIHLIDVS